MPPPALSRRPVVRLHWSLGRGEAAEAYGAVRLAFCSLLLRRGGSGANKVVAGAPLWQWGAAAAGCIVGVGWINRRQVRRVLRTRLGIGGSPTVRVRAHPLRAVSRDRAMAPRATRATVLLRMKSNATLCASLL